METHLDEPLTLAGIARHVGVSGDYLLRLFRHDSGSTPLRTLKVMRLRAAERLLSSTQLSLKEVAAETGFSGLDLSHFIRDFKAFSGISPGRYRRTKRRKKLDDFVSLGATQSR